MTGTRTGIEIGTWTALGSGPGSEPELGLGLGLGAGTGTGARTETVTGTWIRTSDRDQGGERQGQADRTKTLLTLVC